MHMKTYQNHRAEPYFTYLKNGQKTIEGRLQKGWYRHVATGDRIVVSNNEESDNLQTEVVRVAYYGTFKEMLETENIAKTLPDAESIAHGVEYIDNFIRRSKRRNMA